METLIKALQSLPVSVAILDAGGMIVEVNDTWREFGRLNGLQIPSAGVGANYLACCEGSGAQSLRLQRDLRDLLAGRLDLLTTIYPCHSSTEKRWFCLVGLPFPLENPSGAVLLHVNLLDMIPLRTPAYADQLKIGRSGSTNGRAELDAIGGAVERSVSEALSSQLRSLLAGNHHPARKDGFSSDGPRRVSPTGDGEVELDAVLDPARVDGMVARARLSRRQMQILRLLGTGKTNKEIADALYRSPNTIKLHVSAILDRLNLKSRTQAALLASRLPVDGPTGS